MHQMFQSDVDFAVFLSTRNQAQVKRERFVQTITDRLAREYENETEHKRLLIRANRVINERKAS
jgi:hypothetical protein